MSELKIKAGKLYKTRDGRKARIYAADIVGKYPIHGAIFEDGYGWECESWRETGQYSECAPSSANDIVAEWTDEDKV